MFVEIVAYSELAIRNNASVVEYCRTSMAALSGGTAGLLGLTGFYGFGFYVFAVVGLWVSLVFMKLPVCECHFFFIRGLFILHDLIPVADCFSFKICMYSVIEIHMMFPLPLP